jgi:serine/threonine protein kinase
MAGAARKKLVGRYEVGRTIGQGAFAKVKFAVDTDTGAPVAMKVLDKATVLDHHMLQQVAAPPLSSHLIRSQFPVARIQIKLLLLPLPSNPRLDLDPINFLLLLLLVGSV